MRIERLGSHGPFRSLWAFFLIVSVLAGCSSIREVPLTVSSDPPGSYVLLQTLAPKSDMYDWVYLGTTPLVMVRPMDFQALKKTEAVTLRVMKEGYFEQTKSWSWKSFVDESKKKGGISWDPHLVPMAGENN